ncbi:MAG: DUF695 domain-containing protein [Pseudomonadota bacterium]
MSENWDFYALQVDGEPASIFLDLGMQSDAPHRALSHMAYVSLAMNQPRPDGLSSHEEFDALLKIEKAMQANLCAENVVYVGRNTSGGSRDFYFYTSAPESWQSKVARVLSVFDDYEYEADTREHAKWSTYFDFLLPGEIDRQRIENRRVCQALEQRGDALVAEREIDHWSYFDKPAAADAYLAEIVASGFVLRARSVSDEGELRHVVQAWRADVPSYRTIDAVTLPLFEAAARHGGRYDGWECPVEA